MLDFNIVGFLKLNVDGAVGSTSMTRAVKVIVPNHLDGEV